ncbi:pentatricopeptide repeat-containing protein [Tanacetum coccineum]
MSERSVFTWNGMIGGFLGNGEAFEAIGLFFDMVVSGVVLDGSSFTLVFKACGEVGDWGFGVQVHGLAVINEWDEWMLCRGFNFFSLLCCGQSVEAVILFKRYADRRGCANTLYFCCALQACEEPSYMVFGKELHAYLLKSDLYLDKYVANALIVMYTKCGKIKEAERIFNEMDEKDSVTWNSMLSGYVQNGLYDEAMAIFHRMQVMGQKPDRYSVISMISTFARLGSLSNGLEIHAYAMKNGMDSDLQVCNTLVDMYAKCSKMDYAESVFERLNFRDSISWTTVITGYAQNGYHLSALTSFHEAQMNGIESDSMLIASILQVCSELKLNSFVKEIHGQIIRKGLYDIVLENTLVNTYGKCECMDYATRVFENIKVRNVVSWTIMMCCLVQNGLANEALDVFISMKEVGIEPDSISLLSLLSAVSDLSALKKGKEIHGYLIRKGFVLHGPISSSLVDMYASCGSLKNSVNVFDRIEVKDIVLLTSMVNAYGMHGFGKEAVSLFKQMVAEKIIPDHVSFLAILYACSHSSLINEGKGFFKSMVNDYNLKPWPEHYTCIVDLLSRANNLEEAFVFVENMEMNPNVEIWRSLLGACKVHNNVKLGNIAAKRLLELDPDDIKNYVLVSNFYASCNQLEDLEYTRKKMRQKGLKKDPGCSWIEVKNQVQVFTARDKSHPESDVIYHKLAQINDTLKRVEGYTEKDKAEMLNGHSERLAIAYGLLNTSEGTPIRITKNLRVCDDCHAFSKLVSKYFEREITVRDANRFHHFGFGVCSCKDFW